MIVTMVCPVKQEHHTYRYLVREVEIPLVFPGLVIFDGDDYDYTITEVAYNIKTKKIEAYIEKVEEGFVLGEGWAEAE